MNLRPVFMAAGLAAELAPLGALEETATEGGVASETHGCCLQVLAGQECSEKADIWSLGVVLWEIVTGERPHLRQLRPLRCPSLSCRPLCRLPPALVCIDCCAGLSLLLLGWLRLGSALGQGDRHISSVYGQLSSGNRDAGEGSASLPVCLCSA